jgi:prepilin-type N-terminal cleavage/methylation domain-containing protein
MFDLPQMIKRRLSRDEKGVSLIETLIAIALLGIIGSTLMSGMMGIYKATPIASEQDVGKNLAQSQMETVLEMAYQTHYSPAPVPAAYAGYTVNIVTDPFRDGNIERITITVQHDDKEVATLEALKTNR